MCIRDRTERMNEAPTMQLQGTRKPPNVYSKTETAPLNHPVDQNSVPSLSADNPVARLKNAYRANAQKLQTDPNPPAGISTIPTPEIRKIVREYSNSTQHQTNSNIPSSASIVFNTIVVPKGPASGTSNSIALPQVSNAIVTPAMSTIEKIPPPSSHPVEPVMIKDSSPILQTKIRKPSPFEELFARSVIVEKMDTFLAPELSEKPNVEVASKKDQSSINLSDSKEKSNESGAKEPEKDTQKRISEKLKNLGIIKSFAQTKDKDPKEQEKDKALSATSPSSLSTE
eukprot:TRINITY_DN13237_c0_g1_i2.p1 TRINITY_DN13237_c0_g1~~TRINITY_DN13237_c0_g1_i2.p1  ORF type:complete len:304 (+),score=42.02 TRINITY_DN13237_c0_g1_i2:60-914(+)